jgi:hypothetical protein
LFIENPVVFVRHGVFFLIFENTNQKKMAEIISQIDPKTGETNFVDRETGEIVFIETFEIKGSDVIDTGSGEIVFTVQRDGELVDAKGQPARVTIDPKSGQILVNGSPYGKTNDGGGGGTDPVDPNNGGGSNGGGSVVVDTANAFSPTKVDRNGIPAGNVVPLIQMDHRGRQTNFTQAVAKSAQITLGKGGAGSGTDFKKRNK